MSELDALDPVPARVSLVSGTTVQIEDLRARQFFKLLRIITHGALPALADTDLFRSDIDAGDFAARLLSIMLLAIPDAEEETITFVRSMVKPVGLAEHRMLDKADRERNAALTAALDAELANPDLDDLVSIVEAIVRREAADIQALGKRLAGLFRLAEKTGQLSPSPTSTTSTSSADSPSPSTFSRASTDGMTSTSPNSASDDSDSVSQQYANAGSTASGGGSNS